MNATFNHDPVRHQGDTARGNRHSLNITPRSRHGAAAVQILAIFAATVVVGAAAIFVSPAYLQADENTQQTKRPRQIEHQQVVDGIAALISGSVDVLAIHPRKASPFFEIVLWLDDSADPGRINLGEIGVLSHSEVMRTISLYTIEPEARSHSSASPERIKRDRLIQASFPGRWRKRLDVSLSVIARAVIAFTVEPVKQTDSASTLGIGLIWDSQTADEPDEAFAVVEVASPLGRPSKE